MTGTVSSAAFSATNLSKTYPTKEGGTVHALESVSFEAPAGSITCIVGPTGSGKSTILRIASGLETAYEGSMLVGGMDPHALTGGIAYLTQQHTLFPWLTVRENISLPLDIRRIDSQLRHDEVERIARMLGIEDATDRYPHELSGGMQQRAALGRLLATDARFWLMDEPFASLDDRTSHQLQRLLLGIVKESDLSVLFVTHAIDEAVFLADEVIVLSAGPGRIVDIIDIDIPYPRSRISAEFGIILERIRCLIESVLEESP